MKYRSDIKVELLNAAGSDTTIVSSALVSSGNNPHNYDEARQLGLIKSLMRQKHGSPFESGYLEFRIEAPRAVRDEHVRHRIGSYSSESLRYSMDGEAELYVPPPNRPLKKAADHKSMKPSYEPLTGEEYWEYSNALIDAYQFLDDSDKLICCITDATEARRWITTDSRYVDYIARFNPRSLMAFLSLRTNNESANHISFPMWEIEQVALQIEDLFGLMFPYTYEAFSSFGREAP